MAVASCFRPVAEAEIGFFAFDMVHTCLANCENARDITHFKKKITFGVKQEP